MNSAAPTPRTPAAPEPLRLRLDQVRARIRWLRTLAGVARLVTGAVVALVVVYGLDRWLVLPRPVRACLLLVLAAAGARLLWRGVVRPLVFGPDRVDAARLVETALPALEGRLISTLQIGGGAPGSLEAALQEQALSACREQDLRQVLVARPALREVGRAGLAVAALLLVVGLARPHAGVFAQRWLLRDTSWPRDTRLALRLAPSGPGHVVLPGGEVVAARGGVLEAEAAVEGSRPERIELVIEGERGERAAAMAALPDNGGWRGKLLVERGDSAVRARGGDDDGSDNRLELTVVDPPRLDEPQFLLEPPAYLGQPTVTSGAEGLALAEGTRVTVSGRATAAVQAAELRLSTAGLVVPMEVATATDPPSVKASFAADASDTLSIVLTGQYGLSTPDPSHIALLVEKDKAPTLRVFAPARSDVKVTPKALLAFAALAGDDHGLAAVTLQIGDEPELEMTPDAARPDDRRLLVDLAQTPRTGALGYTLRARDGRDLPGRGPQVASVEGRRVDIAEEAEVQRVLADRQLRLKETFKGIRDRQQAAQEATAALLAAPPAADDPELVSAVVAQNQITTRLASQVRELCSVLDETLWNRLDGGPGAETVLQRRVDDWRAAPLDESAPETTWSALAADYAAGRFGRLDTIGRLLDMAALAIDLEQTRSPEAWRLLAEARAAPGPETLAAAQAAQQQVLAGLDQLLGRMDEWEDFQEVLRVVKSLIEDQRSLRNRTQSALTGGKAPQ
jgi:hypothetical protein